MAERPEDWAWSDYRAFTGKEQPHPCLTTEWILGQFNRTRDLAEKEYRKFVKWGIGEEIIWNEVKGWICDCQDLLRSYVPGGI